MWKPKFGICVCHGQPNLLVVKKGYCKKGNEEQKNAKKEVKKAAVQKQTNKLVKKINDLEDISILKDKLDAVFSLFIRHRDSKDGYNFCFTCNAWLPIKELQDGHYESRRFLSLRWEETNNHPQCYTCNITKNGNYTEYAIKMLAKYGEQHLQMLTIKKHNTVKMHPFEYRALISEYTNKLNKLLNEH